MAFNKGYELKKFEAHWEKLRIEYAAAGMAEDAIQKMYDYDRQQFNSERTCIERTQEFTAPAYESTEEEASPLILRYQEAIATVYKGNIIKINNGLPILRRDTAQTRLRAVFLYLGKKGGTTPPGPDEKSGPFFHAQNQEVNVYAR